MERVHLTLLPHQFLQILMLHLSMDKQAEMFKIIIKKPNVDRVSQFWETLDADVRLSIWDKIGAQDRLRVIQEKNDILRVPQLRELWDLIGTDRRR